MRVSCVTTEPPRSVLSLMFWYSKEITDMYKGCVFILRNKTIISKISCYNWYSAGKHLRRVTPYIYTFASLMPPGPYRAMTCREKELAVDHMHTLLTTRGHGGSPYKRTAGATSETTRTLNTAHIIHSNKADMRWLNDIWGPGEPKSSWHLSFRWGKTPKRTSHRKLVPSGDRIPARCVTGAYATACSPAVDT